MSQHLRSKGNDREVSYAALEVACHALEKHCDKLKANDFNDLIVRNILLSVTLFNFLFINFFFVELM